MAWLSYLHWEYLWGAPMTWFMDRQKSQVFKFLKSPAVLSSISLRTTFDIIHGLAKISSLKFLKCLAILSSLGIYLRTIFEITHGLAKISSLKFLKSPTVLPSLDHQVLSSYVNGISKGWLHLILAWLVKISSLKFLNTHLDKDRLWFTLQY